MAVRCSTTWRDGTSQLISLPSSMCTRRSLLPSFCSCDGFNECLSIGHFSLHYHRTSCSRSFSITRLVAAVSRSLVTEISAIGITILLARQVGRRVEELQEAVIELTIGGSGSGASAFNVNQGQIYREIRRARRYHRPAALMAVCATDESMKVSLNRFIQEAQREITRKYVNARMASFLIRGARRL